MTRCWAAMIACLVFCAGWARDGRSATYTLGSGEILEGDPISYNAQGLVVKKSDGTFATRVPWTNFNQNALKELNKDPKAKQFVEALVEADEPEDDAKRAIIDLKPKIPDRLERPDAKAGYGALFVSPVFIALFVLLYAANLYAAFEISIFRNYPIALVCGVAAVLPVVGPILFVCLPTRLQKSHDELAAESMAQHLAAEEAEAQAHGTTGDPAPDAAPAPPPVNTGPQPIVYLRGQTTFNRRFFETKFAGFLRMVPGEAEKDMVIYIRSARGEHVGPRLSRIQPNELYLQINKGGATSDVMIPFNEIMEIQVRPKDMVPAPSA